MSQANALQQWVARLLASTMVVVSILSASAQAAMIPTQKMLSDADRESTRAQVLAVLDQQQARDTLLSLGVDPAHVEQRVAEMTADELQAFSTQVEEMQAGGSVVGFVVLVFVILIVLDLLGTTNIFPAIKPVNNQ
ncbi:MAG: PA2779 family protein [Ketobacter sp.]